MGVGFRIQWCKWKNNTSKEKKLHIWESVYMQIHMKFDNYHQLSFNVSSRENKNT